MAGKTAGSALDWDVYWGTSADEKQPGQLSTLSRLEGKRGRKGGAIEFDGVVCIRHLMSHLDGWIQKGDEIRAPTSTLC